MKHSVAMMACVLSGALMISAVTVRLFVRKTTEQDRELPKQMKQRMNHEKQRRYFKR